MQMKSTAVLVWIGMALALAGCAPDPQSPQGFTLPEGDIKAGKAAFADLGCNRCHTVAGAELPAYEGDLPVSIELGGEVYRVKTYGQLVTAIINPQHVLSPKFLKEINLEQRDAAESPMPSFNDKMTVAQMIDLVAFLQSRYTKLERDYLSGKP
jgi:sulfur-oxidizing protein SoxX